jgi:hypothetical protein
MKNREPERRSAHGAVVCAKAEARARSCALTLADGLLTQDRLQSGERDIELLLLTGRPEVWISCCLSANVAHVASDTSVHGVSVCQCRER